MTSKTTLLLLIPPDYEELLEIKGRIITDIILGRKLKLLMLGIRAATGGDGPKEKADSLRNDEAQLETHRPLLFWLLWCK